jgi:hypothetical protein
MRPTDKKSCPQEASVRTVLSEVEWLRQMVAALTLEEPKHEYRIGYSQLPDGVYASGEGTAK